MRSNASNSFLNYVDPGYLFTGSVSDDPLNKLFSTRLGTTHKKVQAHREILSHDLKSRALLKFRKCECAGKFYVYAKHTCSFLNHGSHHSLTVYALGTSTELISDVYYETQLPKLQPTLVGPSPRRTSQNIKVARRIYHVSCVVIVTQTTRIPSYYDAYLALFTDYLQSHSPTETLTCRLP